VNAGNDFAGKTVYLDKNLDLQGNESKQWTPIGGITRNITFNGIFDGQNHYISGIYIDTEEMEEVGLFGSIFDAKIKKIGVINGYVRGRGVDAGGIVGYADSSNQEEMECVISNCYNTNTVVGYNAGGIAGYPYARIENCCNMGEIIGEADGNAVSCASGIVAYAGYGSKIINCYNMGKVVGDSENVGGIAGFNEEGNLEIKNCYNIGVLNSSSEMCYIGDILGSATNTFLIVNCYFIGTSNYEGVGKNESEITVDATPKTETEMKTQEFVDLLNAERTPEPWKYVQNSYPILSWQK
ncbi:MAG: GLUG motif-containing protein, partial [Clostridia bacterium]